ncbi:MAG: hypothetical protein ACYCR4_13285 [Acidimicrobiales bacterium]
MTGGDEMVQENVDLAARRARIRELIAEESLDDATALDEVLESPERYLLIERSIHSGGLFPSIHASPEDAAEYHDNQECVEYWTVVCLVDLDTGASLRAVEHTSWELFEGACA